MENRVTLVFLIEDNQDGALSIKQESIDSDVDFFSGMQLLGVIRALMGRFAELTIKDLTNDHDVPLAAAAALTRKTFEHLIEDTMAQEYPLDIKSVAVELLARMGSDKDA